MRKRRKQNRVEEVDINFSESEATEESMKEKPAGKTAKKPSSTKKSRKKTAAKSVKKTSQKEPASDSSKEKVSAKNMADSEESSGRKEASAGADNADMSSREKNLSDIPEAACGNSEKIIYRHVFYTSVAGVIPFPALDILAITALQLKMLRQVSAEYGIDFSENLGKSLVASLLGSIVPTSSSYSAFGFMAKLVPVVGALVGATFLPAFAGAATYAVGKIFVQHFESGGTFLDFEPKEVREHFAKLYTEGKGVVGGLKGNHPKSEGKD